jgi:hypothetical protein
LLFYIEEFFIYSEALVSVSGDDFFGYDQTTLVIPEDHKITVTLLPYHHNKISKNLLPTKTVTLTKQNNL